MAEDDGSRSMIEIGARSARHFDRGIGSAPLCSSAQTRNMARIANSALMIGKVFIAGIAETRMRHANPAI
jgi:hypothetical protein